MSGIVERSFTDLLDDIIDNRGRSCPTAPSGLPLIATNCIKNDHLYPVFENVRYVGPETVETWFRGHPKPNDIIFVCKGSPGRVAMVPDPVSFCIAQDMVALRVDEKHTSARYLYYVLSSPEVKTKISNMHVGSMIPHFKKGDFGKLRLKVHADVSEQQAIAEVLGALDDKIAANTKLAATADQLAGNIYDLALANVASVPMSNVLKPVLGGTPSRSRDDFWMGDQLWASAKDITGANFGVITNTDEKITTTAVATTKAKPLRVGSVILTARGTVGAVARLSVPASFNQSCYGFEPADVPAGVLYFSVLRAAQRARAIAHGSVFDTITMKTFDHLPFPSLTAETMAATEEAIQPLLNTISASVVENKSLAGTRDTLLPHLMSGKLRVKDAEAILEDANV